MLRLREAVLTRLRSLVEEHTQLMDTLTELFRHIAAISAEAPAQPRAPAQLDINLMTARNAYGLPFSTALTGASTSVGPHTVYVPTEQLPGARWEAALDKLHDNLTRQRQLMLRMHDIMLCKVCNVYKPCADCPRDSVAVSRHVLSHRPDGIIARKHFCPVAAMGVHVTSSIQAADTPAGANARPGCGAPGAMRRRPACTYGEGQHHCR